MTKDPAAEEEFGRFVTDAYPGLVRVGAFLVGDRTGGEDVAQTALMRVYGAWHRIDDKAAAGAYTRRTMVRLVARGRRRRWNGERPTPIDADAVVTLDHADDLAVADAVHRALAQLPIAQRAVLVLRYFELRTEAEVAALLGVSLGTVKSRAAHGMAALRGLGLLDPQYAAEEQR